MTAQTTAKPRSTWSANAKHAFESIVSEHADLTASALSSIYTATELLSSADKMQARVLADGYLSVGSQGQSVPHPLLSEIRLGRTQYLAAIRALGLTPRTGASMAGSVLANKRWSPRGRSITSTTAPDPRLSGAEV